MKLNKITIVTILFAYYWIAAAVVFGKPSRHLAITGPVMQLTDKARVVDLLTQISKEPIYVYVNSRGGLFQEGQAFQAALDRAVSKGVEVICTPHVAYSAAANILLGCSKLRISDKTVIMWHQVKQKYFGGALVSAKEMLAIGNALMLSNKYILSRIVDKTMFTYISARHHYDNETYFKGDEAVKIFIPGFATKVK